MMIEPESSAYAAAGDVRRSGPEPDALVVRAFAVGLFALVFLQRFAFHVAGYPLQLVLVVVLAMLGYLVWRGSARIDSVRLIGFLLLTFVLALEGLLRRGQGSVTSLGLLLVIYLLSTVVVTMPRATYVEILRRFQWMMCITALLGVAQFFGQFLVPGEHLFTFEPFVPPDMLLPRFNTVIPVQHGASLFKSNGFVFIEPSTFSQFLALAIVIELAVFHSIRRLALFALAYLVTYSGTGLIVLAATLPLFLGSLRVKHVLAVLAVAGAALAISGTALNLEVFVDRAGSFDNEHSSAFARFVGPWRWIRDVQTGDAWSMFLGFGPGSVATLSQNASLEFHDPTWAKVIMEYGIIGAFSFFAFYLYCVFSQAHEWRLNWALLVMFTVTGGALLNPFMAGAVLLLGIMPARAWQSARTAIPASGAHPGIPLPALERHPKTLPET